MKNLKKLAGATLKKNNSLAILNTVLIDKGSITLSDLDTRVTISDFIPDTNISICVDAMDFCDIVDLLQKEKAQITYQQDQNKLTVLTNTEKFNLTTSLYPDDYPAPIATPKFRGTLTKNDIAAMKKCALFAGKDDLRPVMSGVFVEKKKVIGTDAHILHWNNLEGKVKTPIIIPKKVITILDILQPEKIEITANKGDVNILLAFDNIEIIFRAIEGKYPNWQTVLPTKQIGEVIIDKKEMLQTIAKGKKFANQVTQQMAFHINEKGYKVYFQDIDRGTEYVKTFNAGIVKEVTNFGINATMLEKILKTIPGNDVVIGFEAPNRGLVINNNYLLMPVML